MSPLTCPSCGASFRGADLDRANGVAWCRACDGVLNLQTRERADEVQLDGLTKRSRSSPLTMPEQFTVISESGRFEVSWRWFSWLYVFLGCFALIWNGMSALFSFIAVLHGQLQMVLGGSIFVAAGLGLAYVTISGLFNSTRLSVEHGALHVRHGPFPWPGSGSWKRADLAQLYAEVRVANGRSGRTTWYWLSALMRDGRRVPLVKGMTTKEQVQWLEQVLERRLEIVDAPVEGELPKALV